MPRRRVLKPREIYNRRASAWADYYKRRNLACEMQKNGWNGESIARTLEFYEAYGGPQLGIDGWLLDVPLGVRQKHEDHLLSVFRLSDRGMLCPWWWTEGRWMEFVHAYQSLPDVYEDYYFLYQPMPIDRLVLVRCSRREMGISIPKKVQVPYCVV